MKNKVLVVTLTTLIAACSATATDKMMSPPFSGPKDVAYAADLWNAMLKANLVGSNAILSTPYVGQAPHGAILDTIESKLTLGNNSGEVIIKRNYGGMDVSKMNVANDPVKYLKAVTVMYRVKNYNPDNKDWFWVKYKPDGSLHTNPKGMKLAGKIAKGMDKGCIACHMSAPGGDYVFNHDRYKF